MIQDLSAEELAVSRAIARVDLYHFARHMFLALRSSKWQRARHHKLICDALTDVFNGRTKNLLINIPPRYSKTELVKMFTAWSIGNAPDSEYIYTSYSADLAVKNSYECREIIQSDEYRAIFPDVRIKDDSSAKDHWRTSRNGCVFATGARGTITGYGAGKMRDGFGGCIVVDDPHKADEIHSPTSRERVITWFQETLESRRNDPRRTPIIVIMQRLHEQDLAGWLLSGGNGQDWTHIKLPALSDGGSALWPEKHSSQELVRMREVSPYTFLGQYQQEPYSKGGGIFKVASIERVEQPPSGRVVVSVDCNFKEGSGHDNVSIDAWCNIGSSFYLLDHIAKPFSFSDTKAAIRQFCTQYRPSAVLIEDKANGSAIIQELRNVIPGVIAINPKESKLARAEAVADKINAGNVKIPRFAAWADEWIAELASFPNGKHDDRVDSMTQYIIYQTRQMAGGFR